MEIKLSFYWRISRIPCQSQKWHKRGTDVTDVNAACVIGKKEPVKPVQMYLPNTTPWQQARVNVAAFQRCPSWENQHEKSCFLSENEVMGCLGPCCWFSVCQCTTSISWIWMHCNNGMQNKGVFFFPLLRLVVVLTYKLWYRLAGVLGQYGLQGSSNSLLRSITSFFFSPLFNHEQGTREPPELTVTPFSSSFWSPGRVINRILSPRNRSHSYCNVPSREFKPEALASARCIMWAVMKRAQTCTSKWRVQTTSGLIEVEVDVEGHRRGLNQQKNMNRKNDNALLAGPYQSTARFCQKQNDVTLSWCSPQAARQEWCLCCSSSVNSANRAKHLTPEQPAQSKLFVRNRGMRESLQECSTSLHLLGGRGWAEGRHLLNRSGQMASPLAFFL